MSLNSMATTTRALLRFADGMSSEMQVFLLRTGQGVVDLRPIEGPAELRATARSPRYNPFENPNGMGWSAFDPRARDTGLYLSGLLAGQRLLSLQNITDALRGWTGRKTVVLFSDGFPIWNLRGRGVLTPLDQVYGPGEDVLDAIERLTDLANRASVVIHAVDPRGLVTTGISAADSLPDFSDTVALNVMGARRAALQDSQASLAYIAEQTGGLAVVDSNDVSGGVARILSGSHAYYLVGYSPERTTFSHERLRFHRLEVKVKRRGLTVHARKGFFGISDEAVAAMAPPPVAVP
jgi:VWFA-related protein